MTNSPKISDRVIESNNNKNEFDLNCFSNPLHESASTNQLCALDKDEDNTYTNGALVYGTLNTVSNTSSQINITEIPVIKTSKYQWNTLVKPLKSLKGILFTILSALFFGVTTVIVKYVKDVDPGEMAFFRYLGILLFTIPMLMEVRLNPFGPSDQRHWLMLRGVAGATSLYFRYSALHYMSIANATVIVLSMPVFVFIFAKLFLKEPFGWFHVFALIVTLVGIAFTSKVALIFGKKSEDTVESKNELIGLAFSLGATLVGSSAYVLVRKIKGLHHSIILFNFSWVAIIETSILTIGLNNFKLPTNMAALTANAWLLCTLALFSFYAQLLLTKALQAEEAGLVSIVRASSEVIYAFIFQITIFKELPDFWSVLGAVLVMTSVLMTSARKWLLTLHSDSKIRRKLNFILK